jgi:succinyl-CoA synthetase beta subunit
MKIHEYQAKEILKKYDVSVPIGKVAFTAEEAVSVAKDVVGGNLWVVKAQIHAGGRGKGGGVKIAKSLEEVKELSEKILGMCLVTHQTGPEGKIVKRLNIEQGVNIEKELYVGITLDRAQSKNVMMVSTEGGMEIEKVAAEHPELILKATIEPAIGLQAYQARELAFGLGLSGVQFKNTVNFLLKLYKAFVSSDASIAEINPLVVTKEGNVMALDAKMNFDDNALYRHSDILELRDLDEEDPWKLKLQNITLTT